MVTVEDVAAVLVLIDRVPVAKLSTVVRVCAIGSSRPCRTDFVELAQWIASITYWRKSPRLDQACRLSMSIPFTRMRELLVLAVIFVFIIYVRFIGIFYSPETPI